MLARRRAFFAAAAAAFAAAGRAATAAARFTDEGDRIQSSQSDQSEYDAGHRRIFSAEQIPDQIIFEKANQPPIQGADDNQQHHYETQILHKHPPF
jgi:hypothetical protein